MNTILLSLCLASGPFSVEGEMQEFTPQVEDLSYLAQRPHVTYAEPSDEKEEASPYDTLLISSEEKQKITQLLSTMADHNVFQLLFERKTLEKLGHDINHVHPMRFIGTVFSNPRLKYYMHQIKRSGFKWDGFIDGFSQRFAEEQKKGNINPYVDGLAEAVGVQALDLQRYIDRHDFEGMVDFLLGNARPQRP